MRRQVKPFVTEYRAANRRTKDASGPGHADREPLWDETPRDVVRSKQDDIGFEAHGAAHRAADALFSGKSTGAAEDIRATKSADPRRAAEAIFEHPAQQTASMLTTEPRPPDRRILRAIEEPDVELAVAPEAYTPAKRRGRKPGSKNRPKPTAQVVPDLLSRSATAVLATDKPVVTTFHVSEAESAAPYPPPQRAKLAERRTRREPFAWVRTKLKPGENWKRRLPKVAW